jgi:hypothetical protein
MESRISGPDRAGNNIASAPQPLKTLELFDMPASKPVSELVRSLRLISLAKAPSASYLGVKDPPEAKDLLEAADLIEALWDVYQGTKDHVHTCAECQSYVDAVTRMTSEGGSHCKHCGALGSPYIGIHAEDCPVTQED